MARKYPKFLWSDPNNTKSEGPFIIHTQYPRFIVKPSIDERRELYHLTNLDVWDEVDSIQEVKKIQQLIPRWFNESGRYQSNHPDDKIICGLSKLGFFEDKAEDFSVEDARKIIKVLFPVKAKVVLQTSSSYGLKHLLERVSSYCGAGKRRKYCSNDTIIAAFELEGFKVAWQGNDNPNPHFNIRKGDVTRINKLFR